jgi:hypothetical protein
LKTYDVGNLQVCTEGISAATVGYLEVEYVIDLMTPQIQDPVGGSQSFTSDVTHIFKAINVTDNDAVLPFSTSGGQTMLFYQSWEGMMLVNINGTVASSLSCAATGTTGSAVAVALGSLANAGATAVQVVYAVRALPGTILTWSPTATTVTTAQVIWGTAAYAGLDFTVSSSKVPALDFSKVPSSVTEVNSAPLTPRGVNAHPDLTQSMIDEAIAMRKKH